ncbi:MAG: phosphotyrosine protein phosphatase [Myxococcales bacterium]|nr:phosphotyrosine protein phosphatase [Myxococcales bacterium]
MRICFVCLGNICRSPTAEGVMTDLVNRAGLSDEIEISSAGTSAWHVGEKADSRSREAAERRGIELTSRASQFRQKHFPEFEYILAMDMDNLKALSSLAPNNGERAKVKLLRDFDPDSPPGSRVPDPYYGGPTGFEDVLDLCTKACEQLLAHIRREHGI